MKKQAITPFVKWAGGKRQLLPAIKERLPEKYNRYFEPFVGGGAVLFELQPKKAIINDYNRSLVHTYRSIQTMPNEVMACVEQLDQGLIQGGRDYYYEKRALYNEKMLKEEYDVWMAALFLFLNKHCFNGLYRVNGKGLFNVPYNNSKKSSYTQKNIEGISKYLKKVRILEGDFEKACKGARKGDFIFFDSPYAPLNPTSFESYTKEGFDKASHIRLAKLFKKLSKRGCYCMLTNHDTELIRELYSEYDIEVVPVKRSINSDAKKRVGEEVIIRNYK